MDTNDLISEFDITQEEVIFAQNCKTAVDTLAFCDYLEDKGKVFIPHHIRFITQNGKADKSQEGIYFEYRYNGFPAVHMRFPKLNNINIFLSSCPHYWTTKGVGVPYIAGLART